MSECQRGVNVADPDFFLIVKRFAAAFTSLWSTVLETGAKRTDIQCLQRTRSRLRPQLLESP